MYILLDTQWVTYLMKVLNSDRWYLSCDYNKFGDACIYMHMGGEEEMLCNSLDDFQGKWEDLEGEHVMEYYRELTKRVFEELRSGNHEYLDVAAIRNEILPIFWEKWQKEGYVPEEEACPLKQY